MLPEEVARIVMAETVDEQMLIELKEAYERISGQVLDKISSEKGARHRETDEATF
jgi:hypothetical protein